MSEIVNLIQELLQLPQDLCKRCGLCCTVTTFKGALRYDEIVELIKNPEADEKLKKGAIDYLSIFVPYEYNDEVKEKFPNIYEAVLKNTGKKSSEISFFKCRHYKNGCTNYENRPNLCRVYPVVHSSTNYFPGCGFEEEGKKRWNMIEQLIKKLENNQG